MKKSEIVKESKSEALKLWAENKVKDDEGEWLQEVSWSPYSEFRLNHCERIIRALKVNGADESTVLLVRERLRRIMMLARQEAIIDVKNKMSKLI